MNDNGVLIGRPFDDLCVLRTKSLNWSSVDVELLIDKIMCCKFTCSNRYLNIVDVYCPCAELINDRIADYLSVSNDVFSCLVTLRGDIIVLEDFNASIDNKFF